LLYRFADFELDEERYELRRGGAVIELQPKVMEVLLHLVRNAERACSKEELIDAVWPDVSVSEASLVRCIAVARRALDEMEAEGEARIIQTVWGRGYRIGVPVESGGGRLAEPADDAAPSRTRRGVWLTAAVLAVAVLWLAWLARPYAELPEPRGPRIGGEHPLTSVAVIPPAGSEPGAEGVALQVIDRLGAIAELRVVSHASSFPVAAHGSRDAREIGRQLAAGTLVFESVHDLPDTTRITFEVVDASSGFQRWSRSYVGRAAEQGPRVADDVARVVSTLVGAGPGFVRKQGEVTALDYYLQGREAVHAANRERLLEAVGRYEQAIELDTSYLDAYVALADAYERLWQLDKGGAGWLDRGEIAVLRARELDPRHSDALGTHATLLRARRQWEEAEAAYRQAVGLGASAYTYNRYAALLCMLGRAEEAEPLIARSLELAPHDFEVQRTAGRVHHYLGNHQRAVTHLLRSFELSPRRAYTPRLLAGALASNGRDAEAREAFLLLAPRSIRGFARIYGRLFGHQAGLRMLIEIDIARTGKTCRGDGHGTAMGWAILGERQRMLDCLAEDVDYHLWYVLEDPVFDPYRDDPGFRQLLSEAGYPAVVLSGDAS
jgi:DNA-binding winged helix-turn-helix (wHTH) protein/tetratricopeptide (TPR) repeat protein